METKLAFEELAQALAPYGQLESASFVQGMLVGQLSAAPDTTEAMWIKQIVDEGGISKIKESFLILLHQLYTETLAGLNSADCDLTLLMPDDEAPLARRVDHLSDWCEGFLYGMGLGQLGEVSREVTEVLSDFGDIAMLAVPDTEDEQLNASFIEVTEFVRMAAIMVYDEQNPVAKPKIDLPDDQDAFSLLGATTKPTLH
ncbi:UPF0149 family protein [Thiomicrospira microaerophila]|uniref:UPF0149 family protein n=1 Tax=Thiomicrospira microaerophila TaxID=406020 RepID=UPI0006983767|nr:YecA family protein [Thiomicrospira microaerophila]